MQKEVVATGDQLALGSADDSRPHREPAPNRNIAVARDEGRNQGQQGIEAG